MKQLIAYKRITIKVVSGFMLGCIVLDEVIGIMIGPILIEIDFPKRESSNTM
jgi:hypothetical protein